MTNLQQSIDFIKSQLSKDFIFINVKPDILRTLINGLERAHSKIERLENDITNLDRERDDCCMEIDRLNAELEKADTEIAKYHKLHDDGYNEMRIMQEKLVEQKREIEELRHRDKVIGLANDALGRYVREGKEEIDVLKRRMNNLEKERNAAKNFLSIANRTANRLDEQNEQMKKALEWYAEDSTYTIPHVGCAAKVMADKGKRALIALDSLSPKEVQA